MIKLETVLQYQNTILRALREVEDALVNYSNEHMRRNHLENACLQNELALQLAQSSYQYGLVTLSSCLVPNRAN